MKTIYKEDIVQGLTELGLKQGDVVIVHTSLKVWAMYVVERRL